MPHLAHDVDLLQELCKLRRVGRDVAEDLDRDVRAAVGAAVEVAESARGDALVADDLRGVELEVVGRRGGAREGRGGDEAVDVASVCEGAARGGQPRGGVSPAARSSSDRRERSQAGLGAALGRFGASGGPSHPPPAGRRVRPRRGQLRQPLAQDVLELVGRLPRPAVDDEDVEREAVEGVEGVRLADVEVEVALGGERVFWRERKERERGGKM